MLDVISCNRRHRFQDQLSFHGKIAHWPQMWSYTLELWVWIIAEWITLEPEIRVVAGEKSWQLEGREVCWKRVPEQCLRKGEMHRGQRRDKQATWTELRSQEIFGLF